MILAISHSNAVLIGAAALAAILAVLVAAVGYRLARRSGSAAEERTANLLEDLRSRIDDLGRGVSEALEQSREQASERRFGDAGSIDLDAVLGQVLVAARAVPGADAASVTVAGPDGQPLTRADGLTPHDEQGDPLWPPPPGRLRALRVDYEPRGEHAGIRAGLVVPIRAEQEVEPEPEAETPPEAESQLETIGLLGIFARSERGAFSEAEAQELEELARLVASTVRNALLLRDAQQRAATDAQTGLPNKASFYKALAREVRRAERHTRPLALLTFDLDDFKAINERYGHLAADEVVTEIARRMMSLARPEDVLCRTGAGDEFAVILPESTLEGAARFYERLLAAIAVRPLVHVGVVSLSAGIAELWPEARESDFAFLARALAAQRPAKRSGKGRMAASVTFEQSVARAGFTIWIPKPVPPEWAIQAYHLPPLGMLSPAVVIEYASTIGGGETLSLTESPTGGGGPATDVRVEGGAALTVDRGDTSILLESKTGSAEWLARVAETLVPVPVDSPQP